MYLKLEGLKITVPPILAMSLTKYLLKTAGFMEVRIYVKIEVIKSKKLNSINFMIYLFRVYIYIYIYIYTYTYNLIILDFY